MKLQCINLEFKDCQNFPLFSNLCMHWSVNAIIYCNSIYGKIFSVAILFLNKRFIYFVFKLWFLFFSLTADKCEVKSEHEIDAVASFVDSKGNQNVLLKQLLASSAHNPASAVAAAAAVVATVNSVNNSAAVQAANSASSASSRNEVIMCTL